MRLILKNVGLERLDLILSIFKEAATEIAKRNIDHWQYWHNPPQHKLDWLKEGILQNEFFFVYHFGSPQEPSFNAAQVLSFDDVQEQLIGMVRVMEEDLLYWGPQETSAFYIHSLVVRPEFSGKRLGSKIIKEIEDKAIKSGKQFLRLDCDSTNKGLVNYYLGNGFSKVRKVELPLSSYQLFEKKLD